MIKGTTEQNFKIHATIHFRLLLCPYILPNRTKNYSLIIIVFYVFYEYETWSHILRVEHRWRVSENEVLRRNLGPNRDEEIENWRELHQLVI